MVQAQGTVKGDRGATPAARGEREYYALFERVPIGLYRTMVDGRFLDANPALATLLGFRTVSDLLTTNVNELYAVPSQRMAQIAALAETDQAQVSEICLRRQDGSIIWVRDTFCPH